MSPANYRAHRYIINTIKVLLFFVLRFTLFKPSSTTINIYSSSLSWLYSSISILSIRQGYKQFAAFIDGNTLNADPLRPLFSLQTFCRNVGIGLSNPPIPIFANIGRQAIGTRFALFPLRTLGALFTLRALLALGTLFTLRTLFARSANKSQKPLGQCAFIAVFDRKLVCGFTVIPRRTGSADQRADPLFFCSAVPVFDRDLICRLPVCTVRAEQGFQPFFFRSPIALLHGKLVS